MGTCSWTHLNYGVYIGFEGESTYKPLWEMEKLIKESGCDIVCFGLYEQEPSGYILAVKESIISPEGACICLEELPTKKPEWDDILFKACQELRIDFKPRWILSCHIG